MIHPATKRPCGEMAGSGTRTGKMSLENNSGARRCSRNGRGGKSKDRETILLGESIEFKVI